MWPPPRSNCDPLHPVGALFHPIVYQAVPYVGMAKVFDFIHATNDVLTTLGIQLPLEGQSTTTPETRADKGLAVQKEIVGAGRIDQSFLRWNAAT
jgi:4-carboxymuconolactone decarboxylase